MPVWLVTGGSGFLGRHLLAELVANGPDGVMILNVGRRCPKGWAPGAFRQLDLENRAGVDQLIDELSPAIVFHLAGQTPPGSAEDFDRRNTSVTIGLLESLQNRRRGCRIVLAGSAAELGPVPVEDLPVGEGYPCRPVDPYGRSKWQATAAGLGASSSIEVVVGRIFNPIGPGLPVSQALGRFASVLAGADGPLRLVVGDLEARRDFVDVRDIAAGLHLLGLRGQPGQVYHLGTGQSHAVGDGLNRLIELSGRDVTIEIDPSLARNRGPADSRADVRKVTQELGWRPRISWERSLHDLWDAAVEAARPGLTDPQTLV